MKTKQRVKLFIILGVEFIAIAVMLLLIFFAGKQVYTVTFDLKGGTLLSGDPIQKVTQGHSATPPNVTKEGHYFLRWSGSYSKVTNDVVVYAVWEYETTPGIEYDLEENKNYCTISGSYEALQGEVYIGAYKDGKQVLGIADSAFENRVGITELHLLDGILRMGQNAFAGCTALESIELPTTVVSLGDRAFANCESLEEMSLPKKLKTLGNNAFEGCTALEKVIIPEGVESIGAEAFKGCESLKQIVLPSTLKELGENAFAGCTALEKVVISNGVKKIGAGAFSGCTALKQATLFESVEEIGSGAFDNATMLITLYSYEKDPIDVPQTWAVDWNAGNAEIKKVHLELPTEEEDSATDDSEDAEEDESVDEEESEE